jgi:hypothetical protein
MPWRDSPQSDALRVVSAEEVGHVARGSEEEVPPILVGEKLVRFEHTARVIDVGSASNTRRLEPPHVLRVGCCRNVIVWNDEEAGAATECVELDQHNPLVVRRRGALNAGVYHELVSEARSLRLYGHEDSFLAVLR